MKKRVVVLSTGGTIASSPGEDGRNVSGALPGEALVQQLALGDGYDIQVESVLQKPSNALTFDDWLTLHARIQ
ncbi:MAG TPA: asparaginase [Candidatus Paenalcaligenes intestinipullorum]|uniref:Asparaginase n=1 Tax=Candidatus Paenalcaligenes intestinipullorum TaxID=2838718 RepID=A0A9D2RGP1_9BURK|nr:asparaginase [Candidatus Paenalcaligenes intestinipullorum]